VARGIKQNQTYLNDFDETMTGREIRSATAPLKTSPLLKNAFQKVKAPIQIRVENDRMQGIEFSILVNRQPMHIFRPTQRDLQSPPEVFAARLKESIQGAVDIFNSQKAIAQSKRGILRNLSRAQAKLQAELATLPEGHTQSKWLERNIALYSRFIANVSASI